METKLNIAEILNYKPKGTKLYTDAFGELRIEDICTEDELGITLSSKDNDELLFYNDGKYNRYGEPILFPSKEMHDWSKFAWKKGDVLVSKGRRTLHVIFEGFNDDTYTTFKGKHYICDYSNKENCDDEEYYNDYHKEVEERTIEFEKDNVNNVQTYINIIEKKLGGKLNRETLEIEKQSEFKRGNIAFADYGNRQDVFIVSGITDLSEGYDSFISLDLRSLTLNMGYKISFFKENLSKLRLATEKEKQQLFDALAKEGKAWDAEKKVVVDLKPEVIFKPFDKIVACCESTHKWACDMFSHYSKDYKGREVIIGFGGLLYYKALPYNEDTAKLLGTTDNVED